MTLPVLDLELSSDPDERGLLLNQLRNALFNIGFLYIKNHGVSDKTVEELTRRMPALFSLPDASKLKLSKLNSPHFLGYSGFAEEETQGNRDLREQFDFATELPVIYNTQEGTRRSGRDFSKLYWRLRGPNQWPGDDELLGFRKALLEWATPLSLPANSNRLKAIKARCPNFHIDLFIS